MERVIVLLVFSLFLYVSCPSNAAEVALEKVLPSPACSPGWNMDEKVITYDKDTLFDRIDGEAELYFPYGFSILAYARYANKEKPQIAVDADIYKMGSLLDAFGMYANYRRRDDAEVLIGAEGTVSSSQLFFYQDQYLIRLQATGTNSLDLKVFLDCAKAISKNLPPNYKKPKELEVLMVPSIVTKSIRYIAQSFLGYDFFNHGLMGDAVFKGTEVQVIVIPEVSQEAARKTFDQYRSYLKLSDNDIGRNQVKNEVSLKAIDPLYGNVMIIQTGRYLVGAIRVKDLSSIEELLDQIRNRIRN